MDSPAQQIQPTTLNQKLAARYFGVSYSTFRRLRKRRDFPRPCIVGRLTLWRIVDLDAFIAAKIQSAEVAK